MIDEQVKVLTDAFVANPRYKDVNILELKVVLVARVKTPQGVADNIPAGQLLVTDYGTPEATCSPYGVFNPNQPPTPVKP